MGVKYRVYMPCLKTNSDIVVVPSYPSQRTETSNVTPFVGIINIGEVVSQGFPPKFLAISKDTCYLQGRTYLGRTNYLPT